MSNTAQRSFATGEISPALYARTDVGRYQAAVKRCRNLLIEKGGGASNRAGTVFVTALPSTARLFDFRFSAGQTYCLVFTARAVMIVRAGGIVVPAIGTPYEDAELSALQIAQSADVVTIVHPNHPPAELRRTGDASWSYSVITFAPTLSPPANLAFLPARGTAGTFHVWCVTALTASGSESLPCTPIGLNSPEAPQERTIVWDAVPGAVGYNVYAAEAQLGTGRPGSFGFVGFVDATTRVFYDAGITPDFLHQPPVARPLFAAPGDYPGAVGRYQQRLCFGGSTNAPETVWTSRTGDEHNLLVSTPVQDNDAITFTLAGRTVLSVRHLVDAGTLVLFTDAAEMAATGDSAGVLRPTDINVVPLSRHGASPVPPLVIDDALLYVQARQTIVRALTLSGNARQQASGSDLSLYASHLFERATVVDWAYQEVPSSVLWVVLSNGTMAGCTYLPEQDLLAWHRHDTLGTVERVCVVPEGTEDALYLVVVRNGVRCLERMDSRVTGRVFTDASLTYDGAVTGSTLTLSGSTSWAYDEPVTITASAAVFNTSTDPNRFLMLTGADGLTATLRLDTVPGTASAIGYPTTTVPASLRGVAASWARLATTLTGLGHLEGMAVSVVTDGRVLANPNDASLDATVTVLGGSIALPVPVPRATVGLPYVCDLQTLDIDTPSGPSLTEKAIKISSANVYVKDSTILYAGLAYPTGSDALEGMDVLALRDATDEYGPIVPRTMVGEVRFPSNYTKGGSIALRHIDPVPLTVSGIIPRGTFPQTRP